MSKKDKYIMLHVSEEQSEEVLQDGINQGVERGLIIRSQVGKLLNVEFEKIKQNGYFPIGCIIDDTFNVEILFNRHPQQTKEMKMMEIKPINPLKL